MMNVDRKGLLNLLHVENERIMDLLISFNVPTTVEDDTYDDYLLPDSKVTAKGTTTNGNSKKAPAQLDEIEERLNTIRNKMKAKKRPISERAQKKRDAKKLKKNKEYKKVLVSAAKSIKNESKKLNGTTDDIDDKEDKKDIKPMPVKPVFNEEGKIVFSKFDFRAHPAAKVKKSHQNPREILKKINERKKQLKTLKEMGETEKARR